MIEKTQHQDNLRHMKWLACFAEYGSLGWLLFSYSSGLGITYFPHPKYPIETRYSFCESELQAGQQKKRFRGKGGQRIISSKFHFSLIPLTEIFEGVLGVFYFRRHGVLVPGVSQRIGLSCLLPHWYWTVCFIKY